MSPIRRAEGMSTGWVFAVSTAALLLGGCNLLLGIEDATVGVLGDGGAGGDLTSTTSGSGGGTSTSSGGGGAQGGAGGQGGGQASVCGNGVAEGDEACDDANLDDNDACRNTCVAATCGDGVIWVGSEECDDGNDSDTDACVMGCIAARCGDGYVRIGVEGCDDGNNIDTDGCRNDCSLPSCGDGIVQQGEACDDGNQSNTDACLNTCQFASCGDGFVLFNSAEQCDDGNQSNTDDCLNTCVLASCGDGFVKVGSTEYCDDANAVTGDGCHQCQAVAQIAVGFHHGCALMTDGAVKCWGRNTWGQLGQGHAYDVGDEPGEVAALAPILLGQPAVAVETGDRHSCAILSDGTVKCWGWNGYGQLGIGTMIGASVGAAPGDMSTLPNVVGLPGPALKLALGYYRSCAIVAGGDVYCWGINGSGALGLGLPYATAGFRSTAQKVDVGSEPAVEISTFTRHTCVRTQSGNVKCWGENFDGALGIGLPTGQDIGDAPGEMGSSLATSFAGASALGLGEFSSCAIASGQLRCWGSGANGRLGSQSTDPLGDDPGEMASLAPVELDGTPVQVSPGRIHTCALLSDGRVRCWGGGNNGALGHGANGTWGHAPGTMGTILPPTNLSTPFEPALQVRAGEWFSCALLQSRRVKCWGAGQHGRHGGGTTNDLGDSPSETGNGLAALPLP